jgi:hypothetical protein
MPSSSRRDPLQTLEITDFTPGIHSAGGTPTRLIPAPLGAAQLTNTYRCIGLKNGGLGPLPAIARAFDAPSNPDGGVPPVDGKYVAVGFKAIGFVFSTATNSISTSNTRSPAPRTQRECNGIAFAHSRYR